jgi:hypothetical protein
VVPSRLFSGRDVGCGAPRLPSPLGLTMAEKPAFRHSPAGGSLVEGTAGAWERLGWENSPGNGG